MLCNVYRNFFFIVCFKDFLEKVVKESEEFQNIDDVIKRYENLTNIRKELAQKHEQKTSDLKLLMTDVFRRSKVLFFFIFCVLFNNYFWFTLF